MNNTKNTQPNNPKQPPQTYERCPATNRKKQPCKMAAGYGTDHVGAGLCKFHGGSTPAGRKNGAKLLAARQIEAWGGRLNTTAPDALLELIQTKAAEVAYWNWRVSNLTDNQRAGLLQTKTETTSGPQGPTNSQTKQTTPHMYLTILHKTQDQLATYSAAAIKAGIDEAMVRVVATQSAAVIDLARRLGELARIRVDDPIDVLLLELLPASTATPQ